MTLRIPSVSTILRDIFMSLIVIWITSPFQDFFQNWYIYGGLWAGWIVFALFSNQKAFTTTFSLQNLFYACLWPLCIGFLSLFKWANFSPYQFTICLLVISVTYYFKCKAKKSLGLLLTIYIIYVIWINLYSCQQLLVNDQIARILANSDKTVTLEFANPFMANFPHIYNLAILSIALIYLIVYCQMPKLIRIVFMAFLATNLYTLFLAQYSIAILTVVIFTALIFCRKFFRTTQQAIISSIVLTIAFILLYATLAEFLEYLASQSDSRLYAKRLDSIAHLLSTGSSDQGSDMNERFELYSLSFTTFLQNPIFGVGGYEYGAYGLAGGHSDILDNYAYYGVFFGSVFIFYLYHLYKSKTLYLPTYSRYAYKIVFFAYLFDSLFNTCYKEQELFVLYFVIPALFYLTSPKKKLTGHIPA